MTCPDCNGSGVTVANHVRYANGHCGYNVEFRCARCDGHGDCLDAMAGWIETGDEMRRQRIAAGRSLREEAARRGMTPVKLSKMEFGKVEPDAQISEP